MIELETDVAATEFVAVVTTIHPPSECMHRLADRVQQFSGRMIVIGDRGGPQEYAVAVAEYFGERQQSELPFQLAQTLPTGHYSRKNLGYLLAIQAGAQRIYETDDDNAPEQHWRPRTMTADALTVQTQQPWCNVYRHFTDQFIWPRGFPLQEVRRCSSLSDWDVSPRATVQAPIQQGLVQGAPDVDAVWRLLHDVPVEFDDQTSIRLPFGVWCPFNSQNTWWFPAAFPLLYLPSHCSFRMTDLWRSFVAQRCLWEFDCGVVFHAPDARQQRNPHDSLRDFEQEIPGFLHNGQLAQELQRLRMTSGIDGVEANLRTCYECLVRCGFLPPVELDLLDAWLADIESLKGGQQSTGE